MPADPPLHHYHINSSLDPKLWFLRRINGVSPYFLERHICALNIRRVVIEVETEIIIGGGFKITGLTP